MALVLLSGDEGDDGGRARTRWRAAIAAEELLARAEPHVKLRACVERLCGTQRSGLLRLLEERAGQDVASVLGITRGHVDGLRHRAKLSLRECMME